MLPGCPQSTANKGSVFALGTAVSREIGQSGFVAHCIPVHTLRHMSSLGQRHTMMFIIIQPDSYNYCTIAYNVSS
jgi:hypothetical protein